MRRGFAAKVASGLNLADASARPFALSPVRPFAVSVFDWIDPRREGLCRIACRNE